MTYTITSFTLSVQLPAKHRNDKCFCSPCQSSLSQSQLVLKFCFLLWSPSFQWTPFQINGSRERKTTEFPCNFFLKQWQRLELRQSTTSHSAVVVVVVGSLAGIHRAKPVNSAATQCRCCRSNEHKYTHITHTKTLSAKQVCLHQVPFSILVLSFLILRPLVRCRTDVPLYAFVDAVSSV